MYKLIVIFSFITFTFFAQDKLFFADGTSQRGIILSIGKDQVFFKTTDSSQVIPYNKKDLLLIEDYKGSRILFGEPVKQTTSHQSKSTQDSLIKNSFGMQPLALLLGRLTFNYERLRDDGKIGIVIPFSLSFDPFAKLAYQLDTNKNKAPFKKTRISFITGVDVNFYIGKREIYKFFIGPRVRYGTDIILGEVQGYSLQTQMGWRISRTQRKTVQHISFGFGFVRVISSPATTAINAKKSYSWMSLNYRIGIRW